MVVAVDHVGPVHARPFGRMTAGYQQASVSELNPITGSCCVPGPAGILRVTADFDRRRPGCAGRSTPGVSIQSTIPPFLRRSQRSQASLVCDLTFDFLQTLT